MALKKANFYVEVVPSAVYCSLVKFLAAFVAEVGISKVFSPQLEQTTSFRLVASLISSLAFLNALTGTKIWNYTTGLTMVSSPAVADGEVFVGSRDHNIYAFGSSHDVAVINVTTSKTGCKPIPTVGEGYNAYVNVTFENQGNCTETFNVVVYANETAIGTQIVINLVAVHKQP
jgi:hypothetical protein